MFCDAQVIKGVMPPGFTTDMNCSEVSTCCAYCDVVSGVQAIKEVMPPVFKIDKSPEARSTTDLPPPLNQSPLPPMMVVEKGESLDEFVARREPDFFTSLQVSTCRLCACNRCRNFDEPRRTSGLSWPCTTSLDL